jgi:hypothetical protein
MAPSTRVSGSKIISMATAKRSGQTVHPSVASIRMARSRAMGSYNSLMVGAIQAGFSRARLTARDNINGPMGGSTTGSGA